MEPITRSEQYLASILGEDVVLPIPQSRIEYYLNAIAQNGIAPSSAGLINYDPDANYPDGSIGKEMHTLDGDVDQLKSQINEVESGFPQKSASGAIVTIEDGADNVPVVSLTAQIVPVQSGTGDPSPDNVRPISGFTGANVYDTKKNLIDPSACQIKKYVNTHGAVTDSDDWSVTDYISVKAGQKYTLSGVTQSGWAATYSYYDSTKTFISYEYTYNNYTLTIPQGAVYVRLSLHTETPSVAQFEMGTTATAHEDYNGRTVNITWETEAGTVYGGSLVLNQDGTADIVGTHKTRNLGTLDWQYESNVGHERFQAALSDVKPSGGTVASLWCSDYKVTTAGEIYQHAYDFAVAIHGTLPQVWVYDTRYTDATAFKAAMDGVQLVYELATPVTYHIENVELVKTLYGLNNIWCDTGDIDLVYRADPATYTSEQIRIMLNAMVAPVEPTTTASKAYNVNDFLILDNVLYKVIANIASGGTITINTNVSATTIGAEITNILNN